jgi:hypothetical protein
MTTVIAVSSVVVALASLFLSFASQRRAARVALVQTHLALRGRFLQIYQHLPLSGDRDEGTAAMQAYWLNSYDEWFITTKLTPQFRRLWSSFYERAIIAGVAHPVLEQELRRLLREHEGFALYATEFVKDVEKMIGRKLLDDDQQAPSTPPPT